MQNIVSLIMLNQQKMLSVMTHKIMLRFQIIQIQLQRIYHAVSQNMFSVRSNHYWFDLGDFILKSTQPHTVPVVVSSTRSIHVGSSSSGYRTPPTNGRPLETIRHSDSSDPLPSPEHQYSSVINEKPLRNTSNLYDTKYDNYTTTNNRIKSDTITLKLQRDKRVLDFGFSISDRLYGTGVYVNKIRPNGPAELEGTLMPCMRIYQVRRRSLNK